MHELIFRFLLDSGFPRGSVLTDLQYHRAQGNYYPTFLIVDPQTAVTLAVIDVVEAGTTEGLSSRALQADRFAGQVVEGRVPAFVIQVDADNSNASEKVRFYKLVAGKKMKQISSYAFPDLQALQVMKKLQSKSKINDLAQAEKTQAEKQLDFSGKESLVLYGLSLFLLVVCVIDWILMLARGSSLFSLQQILLLITAVSLLAIPLLVRQIRLQR